eukprot:gene10834-12044_t
MIEPLRYYKECMPTFEIERPIFCSNCLLQKQTRNNPELAVIYCQHCITLIGQDEQEDGAYLCKICNDSLHGYGVNTDHIRQTIVNGPGLRKKVIVRGDGVNFPLPLDNVMIQMKARIYLNGHRVHSEKKQTLSFLTGMSGKCVHVQILGGRNLKGRDLTGTSDPFIVYSYCGKPVSATRVKPNTRNPLSSQRDLIKLEVFDHDWITQNDFLGHVEMTRSKLMKLAVVANEQPIRLPLTSKEFHGILNIQFGIDHDFLHLRVVSGEDLDKQDLFNYANPYAKIYIGEKNLIGSTMILKNTIHPEWITGNEFHIKMKDILETEEFVESQIRLHLASSGMMGNSSSKNHNNNNHNNGHNGHHGHHRRERKLFNELSEPLSEYSSLPDYLALIRIEMYDRRPWRGDAFLGKITIYPEQLRKMLPDLMTHNEYMMLQQQLQESSSIGLSSKGMSISRLILGNVRNSLRRMSNQSIDLSGVDYGMENSRLSSTRMSGRKEQLESSSSPANNMNILNTINTLTTSLWQYVQSWIERCLNQSQSQPQPLAADSSRISANLDSSFSAAPIMSSGESAKLNNSSPSRGLRRTPSVEDGSGLFHTPSASTKRRSLGLRLLSKRNNMMEIKWTEIQRFPLMKFSMKSYVNNLGLGLAEKDQGFLIVRLLISSRGAVISGLDEGVRKMTIGETALIKCRYDSAYGNFTLGPHLPPRANIVFRVRLLEINGYGRLAIPTRILRRLWRIILSLCLAFIHSILSLFKQEPVAGEVDKKNGGAKDGGKPRKGRANTRWSLFSAVYNLGLDNSDEESDDEEDSYLDEYDYDNQFNEAESEDNLQPSAPSPVTKFKPDPHIKKHLTNSVNAGAKLMWNVEELSGPKAADKPSFTAPEKKTYEADEFTKQLLRIQQLRAQTAQISSAGSGSSSRSTGLGPPDGSSRATTLAKKLPSHEEDDKNTEERKDGGAGGHGEEDSEEEEDDEDDELSNEEEDEED